ncbi:hypothetical protein ASD85_25255 [Rhizobium sp. Root651]|nr:hypothetical protein ASD85_25255 [Rhizobium sp. Root651]
MGDDFPPGFKEFGASPGRVFRWPVIAGLTLLVRQPLFGAHQFDQGWMRVDLQQARQANLFRQQFILGKANHHQHRQGAHLVDDRLVRSRCKQEISGREWDQFTS